jgi:hypothetical protein
MLASRKTLLDNSSNLTKFNYSNLINKPSYVVCNLADYSTTAQITISGGGLRLNKS